MHFELFFTVLAAGTIQAGLYGFLPISIILSYRISRTIAFVHGGIAAAAALIYWLAALKDELLPQHLIEYGGGQDPWKFGNRPEWPVFPALLFTLAFGAIMGSVFGLIVMSRKVAGLAVLTLTIISAGAMMGLIGVFGLLNVQPDVAPPSPFGNDIHQVLPQGMTNGFPLLMTNHKIFTLVAVVVLSAALAAFLTRTHTGLVIRALADDQEAGVWCGIKLRAVGTFVYGMSGAIAALAGVLIAVTAGPNPADMLVLFLTGLAISVVGGMRSLPLAFAGALLFGIVETALQIGFFGEVKLGLQAVFLYGSLLAAVVVTARLRRESFFLMESHVR
ncbi:MAG: branched-chain amino acid ABC transporter permease [Sporichthyaceae bacterium]